MFAIISWKFLFFVDTRKTNATILSVFNKLWSSWQFKMVYLWLQWLISHNIYDLWFSQAFEIVVYNFYHFLHLLKPFLKSLVNPQSNKILQTFFNKTAMEFKACLSILHISYKPCSNMKLIQKGDFFMNHWFNIFWTYLVVN